MTAADSAALPTKVFAFGTVDRHAHVTVTQSVHATMDRAIAAAGRDAERVIAEYEASLAKGDEHDPARMQRLRDALPDLRFHRERLREEACWLPAKFKDRLGRDRMVYDCDWLRYEITEMPLD